MIQAIIKRDGEILKIEETGWIHLQRAAEGAELISVQEPGQPWYHFIQKDEMDTQGALNLVRGIVEQAAQDWHKGNEMERKTREMSSLKRECERFFRSRWFSTLTGLDGEYIIRRLVDESKGLFPESLGRRKKVIRDTKAAGTLG